MSSDRIVGTMAAIAKCNQPQLPIYHASESNGTNKQQFQMWRAFTCSCLFFIYSAVRGMRDIMTRQEGPMQVAELPCVSQSRPSGSEEDAGGSRQL